MKSGNIKPFVAVAVQWARAARFSVPSVRSGGFVAPHPCANLQNSFSSALGAVRTLHSRPVTALLSVGLDDAASKKSLPSNLPSEYAGSAQISLPVGQNVPQAITCDLEQLSNPTPKELLYSALSGCTVFTLKVYFENSKKKSPTLFHDLDMESMTCRVIENKDDHNKDKHVPTSLSIVINVATKNKDMQLSKDQERALLEAAKACPVKRMLNPSIKIETQIHVKNV
jgi:uncharacterized OsmC-like protein